MKMVKAGIAYCALTNVALGMARENMQENKQDNLTQAVALNRVPPTTVRRLLSVEDAKDALEQHNTKCRQEADRLRGVLDQARAAATTKSPKIAIGGANALDAQEVTTVKQLKDVFSSLGKPLKNRIYLIPGESMHMSKTLQLDDFGGRRDYTDDTIHLIHKGGDKVAIKFEDNEYAVNTDTPYDQEAEDIPGGGIFFTFAESSSEIIVNEIGSTHFRLGYE